MTVAELRQALEGLPDDMVVGVDDADDVTCEVQFAKVIYDNREDGTGTGLPYFYIRTQGGVPLFS